MLIFDNSFMWEVPIRTADNKAVIKKEDDPIKAMMQNKLKLTKGHMPTIVRYVNSSRELVNTSSSVPTKFRDE